MRPEQLRERFGPHRIPDWMCAVAPLQRAFIAHDRATGSLVAVAAEPSLLDRSHDTLEVILAEEACAYLRGEEQALSAPVPYRNFVAEARLGGSARGSTRSSSAGCWGRLQSRRHRLMCCRCKAMGAGVGIKEQRSGCCPRMLWRRAAAAQARAWRE